MISEMRDGWVRKEHYKEETCCLAWGGWRTWAQDPLHLVGVFALWLANL